MLQCHMLQCLADSERSNDVPTEGKEALELDEFRLENGSNEPQLVKSPAVNDVLNGKGGKNCQPQSALHVFVCTGGR
jgi:hypothetical protein